MRQTHVIVNFHSRFDIPRRHVRLNGEGSTEPNIRVTVGRPETDLDLAFPYSVQASSQQTDKPITGIRNPQLTKIRSQDEANGVEEVRLAWNKKIEMRDN